MELKVVDRLTLLDVLPKEGNYLTLKIVRQLRESLSFSEEELKNLQFTATENQINWDVKADIGREIPVGEKAEEIITESLKALDAQGKLNEQTVGLFERFCL
jgi:hypothetical protein